MSRSFPGGAFYVAVVLALGSISGCGGGAGSATTPVSVTLSPASATVATGATLPLTATVTGSSNHTVTWDVNGIAGGNADVGTIDTNGQYHAPATVPNPAQVTVRATAAADPSKSQTAVIRIIAAVAVSIQPTSVNVAAGATLQLVVTVSNGTNSSVTWQVNGASGGSTSVGTVSASGLYTAPLAATRVTVTAYSVADPTKSASATVNVLAPHRIGVRQTATNAEFYERTSGKTLVPRGNNYIRLGWETKFDGTNLFGHVTFNVGSYDATRSETELAAMQLSGYNVVTVTTVGCCPGTIGDPAGGLSKAYIANVVDFLQRARAHKIAVTIANQWLPDYGGYTQSLGPCSGQFELASLETLSSCGVAATRAYYTDLMRALIDAAAPLDAIASLELWDEYSYDVTVPPLNATSGSVTTANGQTYDLGDAASRQQMMDDGLVYYADQVGAAIRSLDPTMLVTISFFPPQGPNPSRIGDPRVIQVYPAVARSTLDYIDLHAYPIAYGLTMAQTVENFGMAGYLKKQPVLMGEFGAFISMYPTITDAAAALKDWQIQSCPYGFQGWLLWTWDTDEQPELWNARSLGGVIDQALSPVQRPAPCS